MWPFDVKKAINDGLIHDTIHVCESIETGLDHVPPDTKSDVIVKSNQTTGTIEGATNPIHMDETFLNVENNNRSM